VRKGPNPLPRTLNGAIFNPLEADSLNDSGPKTKPLMSHRLPDPFHCDPRNWKLGVFYFCRADHRIVVPKRLKGLGWTLNFARPLALPFFGFLIALVLGALELARSFGAGGDARFALKILITLGVIALCYRLSHPAVKTPPKP
jgi:hypothetical protein